MEIMIFFSRIGHVASFQRVVMDKARLFVNSTLTKLRAFFPSVKTHANPCHAWLNRQKQSAIYILYYQDKGKPRISPPKITSPTHRILTPDHTKKNQNRSIRALAHSVNQHPQTGFLTGCRQSINRNPKGTPDLSFDDFRERRVNRIFKSDWRVVYRVSGCNPDDKNVWRYSKHTSCPELRFGCRHNVAVLQNISCPVINTSRVSKRYLMDIR